MRAVSGPSPSPSAGRWVVPLADVLIDAELLEAARETLASGWWSMGPRVEAFESEFAALCECEHAVAVANGTAALHIALVAVGCGPGDRGRTTLAQLRRRWEQRPAHRCSPRCSATSSARET